MVPIKLIVLVVVVAAGGQSALAKCTSHLDCELLGTCQAGKCVCAPGFRGPSCGQLDLLPVPAATHGRVWPRTTEPYVRHDRTKQHSTIGWSFAPAFDPVTKRYIAAVEAVCDKWGSDVWLAAVSSDRPGGNWRFERRLGPAGTNCPHMKRLNNGTFTLFLNALTSGIYPANETKDPTAPICVGDSVNSAAQMEPVLRPCGPDEAPSLGHNCLCSRASRHCPETHTGVYAASTEHWPEGPWRIAPVDIIGPGWSPYNASLHSIGTSNPTFVQLQNGQSLLSVRSHRGYWPQIESKLNETYGSGEHTGFAMSDSIEGPYTITGNLSWQYGNDEDPFVWQQPDGSMHCLYHNGRSGHVNHGLHAFSEDGHTWHKAPDALLPKCAHRDAHMPIIPSLHNCSSLYTDRVQLDDGSAIVLSGRERPALLFDPVRCVSIMINTLANNLTTTGKLMYGQVTRAPTWLYNGAIDANSTVPWYAMAQPIRTTP